MALGKISRTAHCCIMYKHPCNDAYDKEDMPDTAYLKSYNRVRRICKKIQMQEIITGIQQVGIGVTDAIEAMHMYKGLFGTAVRIFDDRSAASLMTRYTGDELHNRHAILTMNLSCGGGFELWQFTSRKPVAQPVICLGDIGIFAPKIRTTDIAAAHHFYSNNPAALTSPILHNPANDAFFWVKDCYGNFFQLVECRTKYLSANFVCDGVCGAVIGVTDMHKAISFYTAVMGNSTIVYNTIVAETFYGKDILMEKVLLSKPQSTKGAFSRLLGDIQIELVRVVNDAPKKIFANRYWGDCGHIHLCLDVLDMDLLKAHMAAHGFSFSVDSQGAFPMEDTAGRFCYMEDPDGTLIELVETHKIPILKKLNWYLNLKKRKSNDPLPRWMIKLLALNKV